MWLKIYIGIVFLSISCLLQGQDTEEITKSIEYDQPTTKYLKSFQRQIRRGEGPIFDTLNKRYGMIRNELHQKQGVGFERLKKFGTVEKLSDYTLTENIEVYGWQPHWMEKAQENYNYNLLSTLSYFSYDVNSFSGYPLDSLPIRYWKTSPSIDTMLAKGKRVELTITSFGQLQNLAFFKETEKATRDTLIKNIIDLLQFRKVKNVCLNFEGMPRGHGEKFTNFVKRLSANLRQAGEGYEITLTLPPINDGTYEIKKLRKYISRFVIMGYDYHGTNTQQGPIAPIPFKETKATRKLLNIPYSIKAYYKEGLPYNEMILAFPHYGGVWVSSSPSMDSTRFVQHLSYAQIKSKIEVENIKPLFDSLSCSYYFDYQETHKDSSTLYYRCWFDNEYSLDLKYQWVTKKGLKGVGIWALGYDNGYSELWQTIADNYSNEVLRYPFKDRRVVSVGLFLVKYQRLFIVGGVLTFLFIVIGFVRALFDWRVREALFLYRAIRILYILLLFSFVAFIIFAFELLDSHFWILVLGVLLGFVISYISSLWTFKYQVNTP